ncbi:AAA family ATPase [Natronomonas sp. F2-12]|uniref:AAA family ATPase n=1 Tax=Natronomonas aquatica TaxID=2841590 RepID=A0A9R1D6Z2_9EURY|nr:AAA family ATPase [Natronomonas aquatica]MCQ4334931.1 AAA family ATPase [Natronomonas aquatica]
MSGRNRMLQPRSSFRSRDKVRNLSEEDLGLAPERVSDEDITDLSEGTGFPKDDIDQWVRAINRKKQAIFYGPPGTGKTYMAERVADILIEGGDGIVEILQLHSSYSYEDFVQGIRPVSNDQDELRYPVVQGRFLDFCAEARERNGPCVLILDEINRTDLSAVFGELMHLVEYRNKSMKFAQKDVETGEDTEFSIPDNVYILGTMNTADRSIALVDFALRRRFAFLPLWPEMQVLRNYHEDTGHNVDGLIEVVNEINEEIGDRNFYLGITYFLDEDLDDTIEDIWKLEVKPYLDEYFFDSPQKAEQFAWDAVESRIRP